MTLRRTTRLVTMIAPAVIGVAVVVALHHHPTADRVAVVATGACVVAALLAPMRRSAAARPTPARPYRGDAVEPLAQLVRIQRSVELSGASRLEYEHRLQPNLRHLAAERLRLRRGIDLERRPDAAREVLGGEAWDLVMRRGAASDRKAPAPTLTEIRALFEMLERV
jgi:hypothetical protein